MNSTSTQIYWAETFIGGQPECWSFCFEHDGFYHHIIVEKEFPFSMRRRDNQLYRAFRPTLAFEEWLERQIDCGKFTPLKSQPGVFHPRVWRNEIPSLSGAVLAGSGHSHSMAIVAGKLMTERLFDVFSYTEPLTSNFAVFGHRIREVLLLACMEVESNCAGVLAANNYQSATGRLSTNDYVKLVAPLRLAKFTVTFPLYPEIPSISPFASWNSAQPTRSLSWYEAYNSTKHNRETNFDRGRLEYSINAVAAVAVLLCAQFGPTAVPNGICVELTRSDPTQIYVPLGVVTTKDDRPENATCDETRSTWTQVPLVL